MTHARWFVAAFVVLLWVFGIEGNAVEAPSTQSGLLLQPPLDLAWYTREKFIEQSSTVGLKKIQKPWTSPVVPIPAC